MSYCDDSGCPLLIDSAVHLKLRLPSRIITGDFWSRNHFHVHFWKDAFGFPTGYREDGDVSGFLFRCISLEFHPRDSPHTEIPDDRCINWVIFHNSGIPLHYVLLCKEVRNTEIRVEKISKIYATGFVMFLQLLRCKACYPTHC